MKKEVLYGSSILIGTIIGAGVLGIPYVVAQSGFLTGLTVIIVIGLISMLINLYLGEIILRTKGNHQLSGYAKKYLGNWGKRIMMFAMIFGIYGALLAYLIGEGSALSSIFGGPPLYWSIGFFITASSLIFTGLNIIKKSELIMVTFLIAIIIVISLLATGKIDTTNLTQFNSAKLLLPFGVILFAFIGTSAIPEIKLAMKNNLKKMKKAILIGSIIPIIIYALFTLITVGVLGSSTTEIATIGLGEQLGTTAIILGNLFAVFAMATSFLVLGLALKDTYILDYKLNKNLAFILTVSLPLILFSMGINSFVKVINITGIIAGGLTFILIILIAHVAKKKSELKPEYSIPINYITSFILIVLFLIAIIYQITKVI